MFKIPKLGELISKNGILEKISLLMWTVAVGAYFFQFPFSFLSSLILPALFAYIILQFPQLNILKDRKYTILSVIYILFLGFLVFRGIFLHTQFTRILRFFVILAVIPFVFCVRDKNFHTKKNIFISFAAVKSIILIAFGAIIVCYGEFGFFRGWASSHGLGDIYFLNRFIPKIQVHGNALLVVALMLDYMCTKKIKLKTVIILAGVLCAGNFAFMLALIAFVGWRFLIFGLDFTKKHPMAKQIIIVVGMFAAVCVMPYISSKIQEKADVSNAIRIHQAMALLKANPLVGDGLGNWVNFKSSLITYNGDIYFEMQTLYIFNQIGIIGLGLFYFITLKPAFAAGKDRFILYLIYIFFSFWNPYCFDTTQMFTIILLMNSAELGEYNEKSAYYGLSAC